MAFNGFSLLAVVPARGGSKTIPRKNLRRIGGLSLVGHAAGIVRSLTCIDAALVSTDDEEIAAEGRRHGLDVPFLRPPELASDTAASVDMWRHAWLAAESAFQRRFDISILLEPTSPSRRPQDIIRTLEALLAGPHAAAATVSPAPAHFTPHKCLTLDANGQVGFYLKDGPQYSLRQRIPPYFFRNGICYAVQRETVVVRRQIIESDCRGVVIRRPIVNIDEPFDLELAQFLFERNSKNK